MSQTRPVGANGTDIADDAPDPTPDHTLPTDERQEELQRNIQSNMDGNRAPCAGIVIRTLGELLWVMQLEQWSCDLDPGVRERPDLREVNLSGTLLGDVILSGADLSGAQLTGADLTNATLFGVRFIRADLRRAKLIGAYLPDADLTGADCERTVFRDASLVGIRLSGTYLEQADLTGADLWGAQCDVTTVLRSIVLDKNTRLGDVLWNGVPLTQVDWSQVPNLGDEIGVRERVANIRRTKGVSRKQRNQLAANRYRDVARAYRALAIALRQQGLTDVASRFRLKEQGFERLALKAERRHVTLLWSRILNLVAGYGERPINALFAYLITVLLFMGVYLLITHELDTHLSHLTWDEALVLSVTSFHGRGFFPGTLPLGDWVARAAAIEAIIGLFIELVFIATFSRRFLGN